MCPNLAINRSLLTSKGKMKQTKTWILHGNINRDVKIMFKYRPKPGRWVYWGRSCQHNWWPHILFQPLGGRGSLARPYRQHNPTFGTVSGTEKDHFRLSFFSLSLHVSTEIFADMSSLSCGEVHIPPHATHLNGGQLAVSTKQQITAACQGVAPLAIYATFTLLCCCFSPHLKLC